MPVTDHGYALRAAEMRSKLCGKREREDADVGDQKAPKCRKVVETSEEAVQEALRYVAGIEYIAANWYCNLNKWQTLNDPGFEANRLLLSECAPGLDTYIRITWTRQTETGPTEFKAIPDDDVEVRPHLPTFCGLLSNVRFKLAPPIEFFLGPYYVERLLTAMSFTSTGCIKLINAYYQPRCSVSFIAVADDATVNADVQRLYLLQLPERNAVLTTKVVNQFSAEFKKSVYSTSVTLRDLTADF